MTVRTGEAVRIVHLQIPATLRYLNVACACVTSTCERFEPPVEASFIQAMELAVQEACTNIVRHAYTGVDDGTIDLTISLGADEVVIELHDLGHSFDSTAVPAPNFETVQEHGFGLFLIQQLVDQTEYTTGEDGNRLRLRKKRQS